MKKEIKCPKCKSETISCHASNWGKNGEYLGSDSWDECTKCSWEKINYKSKKLSDER